MVLGFFLYKIFAWRKKLSFGGSIVEKSPPNYLNCKQKQLAYFKERSKEQA